MKLPAERVKYTYVYFSGGETGMAHKTVTISEEAYEALAGIKREKESFTEVILRIVKKKQEGNLLEYFRGISPDEEFAATLEDIVRERRAISLKAPRL